MFSKNRVEMRQDNRPMQHDTTKQVTISNRKQLLFQYMFLMHCERPVNNWTSVVHVYV